MFQNAVPKKTTLLVAGLIFFFIPVFCQQSGPNIVWITIEDTSPDFIGCYGNSQAKTPNIDALAAEGIRFTNAFSTNVVCAPSRHTIITGVRTAEDGCGNHRSTFKIPSYIQGFPSHLKNKGYFTSNNLKTDYNLDDPKTFIQQNWTMQGGVADFTKRKDRSTPFFSVFNFNESHQSRTLGNSQEWFEKEILSQLKKEEIIQPTNLTVPPFYINNETNRRNMARMYNAIQVVDKKVGGIIQMIKDAGEWENTIVFFFSDHGQGMPRFKTNPSRLGGQIPFIIRFPEKYKSLLTTKAGTTVDELLTFEDLAPTMINITTGMAKPGYMKGRIFLGANKEASDNVYWCTRDNTDEVIDMGRTIIKGDFVYTRIYYPHLAVLQHQAYFDRSPMLEEMRNDLRSNKLDSLQVSIFRSRSAEYLFNRKTDKWETENLAGNKKIAGVLAEMRNLLKQKQTSYRDMGFLPEVVLAQVDRQDTLLTWKTKNYAFNKYLAIAEMVGRGKSFLADQLQLLQDKDSVARYWAVVGLRNQQTKDLNKTILQKTFEAEPAEMVKIELAELIYHHFNEEKYLQWLTDLIDRSNNPYIIRQAAMKLANNENLPAAIVDRIAKIRAGKKIGEKQDMAYAVKAVLGTITKTKVDDEGN